MRRHSAAFGAWLQEVANPPGPVPQTGCAAHLCAASRCAAGAAHLVGGVHHVRLDLLELKQALHEESVPAGKAGHREDAKHQRVVGAPNLRGTR